jgi:hypothetical protein
MLLEFTMDANIIEIYCAFILLINIIIWYYMYYLTKIVFFLNDKIELLIVRFNYFCRFYKVKSFKLVLTCNFTQNNLKSGLKMYHQ